MNYYYFIILLLLIPTGSVVFGQTSEINQYVDSIVIIETSLGEITIDFFIDDAPNHVKNFITLSDQGFYDNTIFHRIIPGFMIQGGDPNTIEGDPNTWGTGGTNENLDAEFNSIKHNRGIVSMARSADPNSASSQFFIVHKDSNFLDGDYTVFGEIITQSSFDTLDKIAAVQTSTNDRPSIPEQVKIIKTTVTNRSDVTDIINTDQLERTNEPITQSNGNQIFENKDLDVSFSVPEGWLLQQPNENNPNAPNVAAVGPQQNGVNPVISLTIDNVKDKNIDELIQEKNEALSEAISTNRLEIISQEKIKTNVVQTTAYGILQNNGNLFPIKFMEVMILSEEKSYTLAYSHYSDNFENHLPNFQESINSFKILSQDDELVETSNFDEEGGGCLIATATYGSELAPQVQQLRELRDNQLLQTQLGKQFMSTFNEAYYSFSPTIADLEREHPLFKQIVKVAITPMLSTLTIMESAETESEILGFGLSVIALNLSMYLGVPAIMIIGIKRRN